MKISLKLYAGLAHYLPPEASDHRIFLDILSTKTPNQILIEHSVPPEKAFLLLLNGLYLNSEQRNQAILKEGDVLAAWPPVAGG
ncbi:MAG: MoaD/ThiS family protein [Candidatus Eutrophobiaceae bacterium]